MDKLDRQKKRTASIINHIRRNLGLTMKEFGQKFNPPASDSIVSRWERGISLPNNQRLKKIAELGEISVETILSGDPFEKMSIEEIEEFLQEKIEALTVEDEDEISLNKIGKEIAEGKVFTLDPDQRLSNEDSKLVSTITTQAALLLYHRPSHWGTDPLMKSINTLIEIVNKRKY